MDPPYSPFYPPVYPEGWCAASLGAGRGTRWWVVGEMEGEVRVELNVTWGLPTYVSPFPLLSLSSLFDAFNN